MARARTRCALVVGLGNELLSDEGLGVHVARALVARRAELSEGVTVLDAGTALLDVLAEFARSPRVILIDAVRAGGPPGTVYRGENVGPGLATPVAGGALSLHEFGVAETLRAASLAGLMPARVDLVGAEPARISPGLGLSPELAAAADRIVELLLADLGPAAPGPEAGDAEIAPRHAGPGRAAEEDA